MKEILTLGLPVTTIFLNRTPRLLSIVGIALALDIASTIVLLSESAAALVAVGRFTTVLWLVTISMLIPCNRAARRPGVRPTIRAAPPDHH